jgi:hypothetical protein
MNVQALSRILVHEEGLCGSAAEVETLIESIVLDSEDDDDGEDDEGVICRTIRILLEDYLGLSQSRAEEIRARVILLPEGSDDHDSVSSTAHEETSGNRASQSDRDDEDDDDTEEEELIGLGECNLCERHNMKLTRHHLVPKSTWASVVPRIQRGADDDETGLQDLMRMLRMQSAATAAGIDGTGALSLTRASIRRAIGRHTVDVCRPCHSVVHGAHDNMTLALQYNTLEGLLSDSTIHRHAKWASQQRSGRCGHNPIRMGKARRSKLK